MVAFRGNYCLMLSLPPAWHKPTDFALASFLIGGGITVDTIQSINPWIAFAGGILGLIIGVVRLYEILRAHFTKK